MCWLSVPLKLLSHNWINKLCRVFLSVFLPVLLSIPGSRGSSPGRADEDRAAHAL